MATAPMLPVLERYLDVVNARQQLVVANMANVDTPGYHTRDLDFSATMQQAMDAGGGAKLEPASMELSSLPERPDGNNVNIDRESLLLSQLQLQYQMGVELIKEQFHEVLTAIKE